MQKNANLGSDSISIILITNTIKILDINVNAFDKFSEPSVITTGFFDGLHKGHLSVLQKLKEKSLELGIPSCVVTFWPHPRIVLKKDEQNLRLLSTLEEKKELIKQAGIDKFVVLSFTLEFSLQTAEEFIKNILINKLQARYLVLGYDHHIGRGGTSNYETIAAICHKNNIDSCRVDETSIHDLAISSSKIRWALENRNPEEAQAMLGYPYHLKGTVVAGNNLGRTIGFPTANLLPEEPLKLVPAEGIYAGRVSWRGASYSSMIYIGRRPTINTISQPIVEVHILNLDQDLYGEQLIVYFEFFVREDQKFDSIEELKQSLNRDKLKITKILSGNL